MGSPARRVILGDLHLVRHTPREVTDDLAALLEQHAGDRVIFAGDLFDLSSHTPRVPRDEAMAAALATHPSTRAALAKHVDRGGELWLVSGNHDAEVGSDEFSRDLADALGIDAAARARVRITPWFFRDGDVHVEHGHLFDPDNAPAHPLVLGKPSLGVHFVEEFISPAGAHRFLQANDETPLELLMSSFTWYGKRAPYVIYRYFYAAFAILAQSGPFYDAASERAIGAERVASFARELGFDADICERLVASGAAPTTESLASTFTRLYFDRVLATIAMGGGLGAALAGKGRAGALLFGLGALAMGASWAAGHNRYRGTVPEYLQGGAARVREATGAKLVVFGHTHREALEDGYANTGSFAFPHRAPGRPYLVLERDNAVPERRYWPSSL